MIRIRRSSIFLATLMRFRRRCRKHKNWSSSVFLFRILNWVQHLNHKIYMKLFLPWALRISKWIIIKNTNLNINPVIFESIDSTWILIPFFQIKTITNLPFIWCLPTFCCIISTQRNSWRIHDHMNSDFCCTIITKSSICLIFRINSTINSSRIY